MKHFYIFLLLIVSITTSAQKLTGVVIDTDSGDKLPFVSILYNASLKLGTTTDKDGRFVIEDRGLIERLEITFIGYKPLIIEHKDLPAPGQPLTIKLKSIDTELQEATVEPGENPALRIVRKAIAHADSNDPKKYNSYRYRAYNKNILTRNLDSIISARKQLGLMTSDTGKALINRYLMISEAVSISKYKKPDLFDEKIIGTQISGFKHSIYAVGAENIQYFGLYDDVIQVLTENYLTPLARGADKKYFYILQDTLIHGSDSTFVMYYQPKIGANFEGLTGELHINTNGWAIEYIFAEPYYKGNIDFAIEQFYNKVDGRYWFPKKLTILLQLTRLPMFKDPGFVYSEVSVDSASINIPLKNSEFDQIKRELTDKAPYVDEQFWKNNRPDSLNLKEVKTYAYMDSIGKHYKFNFFMNAARNIYHGYFTIDPFELKVNKFLRYTGYEGLRFGAGVYTSPKFSEKWRVGGYYGYGLKDKTFKYGGTLEYYFSRKDDHKLSFNYSKDVMQPGAINLQYYYNSNFWNSVFINEMDRIEETSLTYKRRLSTYMTLEAGLSTFNITPNNDYLFFDSSQPDATPKRVFHFSEARLNWRWAYKESISSNFGQRISMGTDYPVVLINYSRGISGFLDGEFNYNKVEAGLWLERYIKGWGELDLRLEGGYVDQALPIELLFSNRTSYSQTFSVVSPNTFQTMRFNEFFSDKYSAFFLNHNFGPLLFRLPHFSPEVEVYHAMGIGTLSKPELHHNLPFKTMDKGYYESGLVLANIIHINFFKVGYIGFGAGAFYRYGPYHLPEERNNWAFKISIIYTIN